MFNIPYDVNYSLINSVNIFCQNSNKQDFNLNEK